MALDRPDPLVQRLEVETLDEGPHEPRPVVRRQEAVEVDRAQLDLAPVRALQARPARSQLLGLRWLRRRECEEGVVHAGNRSCDGLSWEIPSAKNSQALSRGPDSSPVGVDEPLLGRG